tara:strand:- start:329 stop:823 length:495 start_codon:yes stop_codon:yes gene_type:complete
MTETKQYALCWDLDPSSTSILKDLFIEFKELGSSLIYDNLYDFHVVEYHSLLKKNAYKYFNRLIKINIINWKIVDYYISKNSRPKVRLCIDIKINSYIKLILFRRLRTFRYYITIASVDTKEEYISDYKKIMEKFIFKNEGKLFLSKKINVIEYVSNKWERKLT